MTLLRGLGRQAAAVFIALCLVSLFADMTYEGGRSVIGSYLAGLGAWSLVAGAVALGDLLNYVFRGVGGFLSKYVRSGRGYWALVFLGYGINLLAVPALALAGRWEVALALVMLERAGKGLRTPLRDAVLAEVTEPLGRGKGFGIHELMDQLGAVSGPLIVAASLTSGRGYPATYSLLAIPAAASLTCLAIASLKYPKPKAVGAGRGVRSGRLGRGFWSLTAVTAALAFGFIHWALVAYYARTSLRVPAYGIAAAYALAMGADAASALPAGYIYDRVGLKSLYAAPPLALAAVATLLLGRPWLGAWGSLIASSLMWGVSMGFYETVSRAALAEAVEAGLRPYAYGMYGLAYGLAWGAGNLAMGALLATYPAGVAALSLAAQALSLAILAALTGRGGVRVEPS